jgi:hypothetical protein
MISAELRELLRQVELTQKIIWFALTLAILLFMVILYIKVARDPASTSPVTGVTVGLYVAAAVVAVISIGYRRHMLSDDRLRKIVQKDADLSLIEKRLGRKRFGPVQALPPVEQKLLGLAVSLQTFYMVVLSLHEVVAVYGFSLAYIENKPLRYLPFMVGAVVLNLFAFPRPKSLVERAQHWVM